MTRDDPFGQQSGRQGKAWFRPRRLGFGYVPQTWQGFLLTALCIGFVLVMAAITGGHSPWMVIAIIPFGFIMIIAAVQNRQ